VTSTPLHQAFIHSVQAYPAGIAISAMQGALTYEELDRKATIISHFLLKKHYPSCGILLAPTPDYYVMLVACMKANCLAIPIDISQPGHQINELIRSVSPASLCVDESMHWQDSESTPMDRSTIFSVPQAISEVNEKDLVVFIKTNSHLTKKQPDSHTLLHCVFTSGTSGVAKKVYLSQYAILHDALSVWETYHLKKHVVLTNIGNYTSSLHLNAFWRCLINQGTFLSGQVKFEHPDAIRIRIETATCTVLQAQPGILKTLFSGEESRCISRIEHLILGGENLLPSQLCQLNEWFPDLRDLTYNYSSTETMLICSITGPFSQFAQWHRIPAGKPAPGKKITLVDDNRQEVAAGEIGEITVTSAYLAEKIDPDTYPPRLVTVAETREKTYYTGDLGRWNEDGMLEHLGRNDRQMKIRGVRIDPVMIEEKMMEKLHLSEVSVVAVEVEGTSYLAACIAPPCDETFEAMHTRLSSHLPLSHIPQYFYSVDSLPKTERGKRDYRRLQEEVASFIRSGQTRLTLVEEKDDVIQHQIISFWKEVLTNKEIAPNQSVFHQGADSLAVFMVLHRINDEFGLQLTAQFFLAFPTIENQAKQVSKLLSEKAKAEPAMQQEELRKKLGL
jgi:acyl-coenzyme A synthetase/AMP-(fatty) acid ligase/acyl carrier protein